MPSIRNSVARAPRSMCHRPAVPADLGRQRPVRPPSRRRLAAPGMNSRSTASSTAFSIGSRLTTQVCPTCACTRPLTWTPAPRRVSRIRRRSGKSRKPASRASPARASAGASMVHDAGRRPGFPPRPPARSKAVHAFFIKLKLFRPPAQPLQDSGNGTAPRRQPLGRLGRQIPYRQPHVGAQAGTPHRRPAAVNVAGQGRNQRPVGGSASAAR